MSVSLEPLVQEFDRTISAIRSDDIGEIPEIERTKVIGVLTGLRDAVRALCLSGGSADSDFPHLASFIERNGA